MSTRLTPGRLFLVLVLFAFSRTSLAQNVLVSNDEWLFSDTSWSLGNDAQLAHNAMSWLTGGGTGNVLILSDDWGLMGTNFRGMLTGMGYTVTQTVSAPATLSGYVAVLVAGNNVSSTLLTDYVDHGGNVFLEGGTACCGGAAGEAAQWSAFLGHFGLAFANSYSNYGGAYLDVSAFKNQGADGATLFADVNSVYADGGNFILASGANPNSHIFFDGSGNGLFATSMAPVPEPETYAMMLAGLGMVGFMAKRRHQV